MNSTIQNTLKFLEDNIVDEKERSILAKTYNNYGFYEMLGMLGTITSDGPYIPPDVPIDSPMYLESMLSGRYDTTNGSFYASILDSIPAGYWTSIRYIVSVSGTGAFLIRCTSSPLILQFLTTGTSFYDGSDNVSEYTCKVIEFDTDIQVNIGFTSDKKLIVESFIEGVQQNFSILTTILSSSISNLCPSGVWRIYLQGNSTNYVVCDCEIPIIENVSNNFLSYF